MSTLPMGLLAAPLLPRVFRPVSAPASSFPVPSPCFAPSFCGGLCSFAFLGLKTRVAPTRAPSEKWEEGNLCGVHHGDAR